MSGSRPHVQGIRVCTVYGFTLSHNCTLTKWRSVDMHKYQFAAARQRNARHSVPGRVSVALREPGPCLIVNHHVRVPCTGQGRWYSCSICGQHTSFSSPKILLLMTLTPNVQTRPELAWREVPLHAAHNDCSAPPKGC